MTPVDRNVKRPFPGGTVEGYRHCAGPSRTRPQRAAHDDGSQTLRTQSVHQFSQELRVATPPGEKLEYLAGVFYLRSSWDSIETQYWNVPGFRPGTPQAGQLFNGPFTNDFTQDTQSAAVFANGTWRATQRVQLSAGLRLTDERKDVVYGRFNTAPLTLWNTMINPPFARTPLEFDGRFLDGNLAAQFELGEQTTLYASYGRGNKLGGFVETTSVPNADPARDARIETETTTSWELGARFRALEDHFRAPPSFTWTSQTSRIRLLTAPPS